MGVRGRGAQPQLGGAAGRGALLWRAAVTVPCPRVPVSRVLPQGTALLQCGVTVRVTLASREEGGDRDGGSAGDSGNKGAVSFCLCVCVHLCVCVRTGLMCVHILYVFVSV